MTKTAEGGVPFPTAVSLYGTSSFGWQFCFLAGMCRQFHQLAEIYVVLFQLILHILHYLFVRV